MDDAALELVWSKYRGWASRARAIRSQLDRWRLYALAFTVTGAVLATLAAQLPNWFADLTIVTRILSAASAVAMALAAWTARSMLDSTYEKDWIRTRALAERAKSEGYRYATRVPPYDSGDKSEKLLEKIKELMTEGEDLPPLEVKAEDASKGCPGHPLTVQEYATVRIGDQVTFYSDRADTNEGNAHRCTLAIQVLSGIAAALAALGAIYAGAQIEAWVATLSAITTAIGAYAMAQRYQRLAATYRLAADRLKLRLAMWKITTQARPDPEADNALILDAEGIMNGENDAWVTDFLKRPATSSTETLNS
jgi:hypothetical protein